MQSTKAVAQFFNEKAPTWDDNAEPSGVKHIAVAKLAGVKEGSRVLDLGCGTGIMVPAYLACGAAEITGLDLAEGMIARAQEKWPDNPNVNFICTDVLDFEDTASPDESGFDIVVIYNAYPHFPDKAALVRKVASLLRPGGRFLVAHGMGWSALNDHHASVPADVTSALVPAAKACKKWEVGHFAIDVLVDTQELYAFGGTLQED